MNRIAQFMKISEKRLSEDAPDLSLSDIIIPKRATLGSAGYDFFMPFDAVIKSGDSIKIPTGIRCRIDEGYLLAIFPRSSLGFKYSFSLANTAGIIDSDYFNADNEGHIFIKAVNRGDKDLILKKGDAFAQGIFLPFGITCGDDASGIRHGGFGSTDKK